MEQPAVHFQIHLHFMGVVCRLSRCVVVWLLELRNRPVESAKWNSNRLRYLTQSG